MLPSVGQILRRRMAGACGLYEKGDDTDKKTDNTIKLWVMSDGSSSEVPEKGLYTCPNACARSRVHGGMSHNNIPEGVTNERTESRNTPFALPVSSANLFGEKFLSMLHQNPCCLGVIWKKLPDQNVEKTGTRPSMMKIQCPPSSQRTPFMLSMAKQAGRRRHQIGRLRHRRRPCGAGLRKYHMAKDMLRQGGSQPRRHPTNASSASGKGAA